MPPPSPAEAPVEASAGGDGVQPLDTIVEEEADFGDVAESPRLKKPEEDEAMPQAGAGTPHPDEPASAGVAGGA
eukprot:1359344-Alexandrium_andersonii.AAC.1